MLYCDFKDREEGSEGAGTGTEGGKEGGREREGGGGIGTERR